VGGRPEPKDGLLASFAPHKTRRKVTNSLNGPIFTRPAAHTSFSVNSLVRYGSVVSNRFLLEIKNKTHKIP